MGDRSSFGIRKKISFMEHRRYLPENHVWKTIRLHNGKVERRVALVEMNRHEVIEQVDQLEFLVLNKHPTLKEKKESS